MFQSVSLSVCFLLPYILCPSSSTSPTNSAPLTSPTQSGRNFYGPGGPYENFAGRDATRGLALQSFDDEVLTKNLDGPLDDLKGLDKEAMENLQGWVERFDEKVRTLLLSGRVVLRW